MTKKKILDTQKKSLKRAHPKSLSKLNFNHQGLTICDPVAKLLDEEFLGQVIWECLKNNDAEGVIEVIQAHLKAKRFQATQEKTKKYKIPTLTTKNPSLKTLTNIIYMSIASSPVKRMPR